MSKLLIFSSHFNFSVERFTTNLFYLKILYKIMCSLVFVFVILLCVKHTPNVYGSPILEQAAGKRYKKNLSIQMKHFIPFLSYKFAIAFR